MTINLITNFIELMPQLTKNKLELFNDVLFVSNQFPLIIILTSTYRATATVVNKIIVSNTLVVCSVHNHSKHSNVIRNTFFQKKGAVELIKTMEHQTQDQIQSDVLSNEHNLSSIPISIYMDVGFKMEAQTSNEPKNLSAISRPTTLASNSVSLSAPKTPEFSISPAESLSKASSNEQMFSNSFMSTIYKAPHSASSLSVNFCK